MTPDEMFDDWKQARKIELTPEEEIEYRSMFVLGWSAGRSIAASVPYLDIGVHRAHYDGPNVCRAFTYNHQPDNNKAWSIGLAARDAMMLPSGDPIDMGLCLLKTLEREGFGVYQLNSKKVDESGAE